MGGGACVLEEHVPPVELITTPGRGSGSLIHFLHRPTSRSSGGGNGANNSGLTVGIADDQAKDFDFEKTEMKYDSTGMFHWCPARSLEDCILVCGVIICKTNLKNFRLS